MGVGGRDWFGGRGRGGGRADQLDRLWTAPEYSYIPYPSRRINLKIAEKSPTKEINTFWFYLKI